MSRLTGEQWQERAALLKRAGRATGAEHAYLAMLVRHGKPPAGVRCGDCTHLVHKRERRTYRKCERYGITSGPATDWRASWAGCGLFERRQAA